MKSKTPIIVDGARSREEPPPSIPNQRGPDPQYWGSSSPTASFYTPDYYHKVIHQRGNPSQRSPIPQNGNPPGQMWRHRHSLDYASHQLGNYPIMQLPHSYPPPISYLQPHATQQIAYPQNWVHQPAFTERSRPEELRATKPKFYSKLPRGPPRKPRQSGHAIWVGSLPFNTRITDLRDHFSDGFTLEIESVFLMLKSNCAFINYTTERSCREAAKRFQNSQFLGVSLVCRTRKSPTDITDEFNNLDDELRTESSSNQSSEPAYRKEIFENSASEDEDPKRILPPKASDRFFILKSLSVQDLVRSVRYGIWTTQNHNEELLNKAYNSAENVFLIFSANKSGEYFGYARMISPADNNSGSILDTLPPEKNITDSPKTILTPASEFAPPGYIFEDPIRGTLFWESKLVNDKLDAETKTHDEIESEHRFGGRPFGVTWISTIRVPFSRTRGLRNAWNGNKDIKVARDGTELEPSVGKQLIELFHK